jgi:hypothetical protein
MRHKAAKSSTARRLSTTKTPGLSPGRAPAVVTEIGAGSLDETGGVFREAATSA